MLNNTSSTKLVFVFLIAVLVQAFLFASTTIINTALASGDSSSSSDSSSSGSSGSQSFSNEAWRLETSLQITGVGVAGDGRFTQTDASSVLRSVTTSEYNYFASITGGTRHYSNGDGTYNTITYTGSSGGGDNCTAVGCDSGGNSQPYCPSGTTMITSNTTCCPNQYVAFTPAPSGKGSGNYSCNAPPPIPPPSLSFTADQYTIPYNTATNLRWTSSNTVSCSASGAWGGSKAINGTESTGNLTSLTTYFLQCLGINNQNTSPAVVNINIQYGEGAEIEVDPPVTRKGNPVTVTWDTGTSDPANCQIQTGAVILQSPLTSKTGSLTHIITGETIFTLNCEGNRNNADATVKVLPEFQET